MVRWGQVRAGLMVGAALVAEARTRTLIAVLAPVVVAAVVLGQWGVFLPAGVFLAVALIAMAAASARTAAVLLALTCALVAVGEVDVGFKALPSYFVAAGGLAGILWRREWRDIRPHRLDVVLLAFAVVAVAVSIGNLGSTPDSTVVSASGVNGPELRSLAQLAALLVMCGMYALIRVAVRRRDDLDALVRGLIAGFFVVGAFAVYQAAARLLDLPFAYVNNRRSLDALPIGETVYVRINSTLPEASPLGAFCVIVLLVALTRIWGGGRTLGIERRTAVAAAVLAGVVLLATLSKSALIAASIVIIGLAVSAPTARWVRRKAIVAAFVVALIAAAALVLRNPWVLERPSDLVRSEEYLRVGYWSAALDITTAHPLGVGVGNYTFFYPRYAPLSGSYEFYAGVADAHNWYLEAFAETGILGGLLFLTFALGLAWAPLIRMAQDNLAIALGLGWTTCALMHVTYSYFYYPFEWVVAGGVVAALALKAEPKRLAEYPRRTRGLKHAHRLL